MTFDKVLPELCRGTLVRRLSRPHVLIGLELGDSEVDPERVPTVFKSKAVQNRSLTVAPVLYQLEFNVVSSWVPSAMDLFATDWFEADYVPRKGQPGYEIYSKSVPDEPDLGVTFLGGGGFR